MSKFIYMSWIIGSLFIPVFYMSLLLVSAFGILSGILNLTMLIGYGVVWYYIYKTIGNSYVRKGGRK